VVEVRIAEAGGCPGVSPDLSEQAPEALARELGLGGLAAAIGRPKLVVDPAVHGDRRGRAAEAEGQEGLAEGRALGPVEVQERAVEVEEDGAETVQAATWPGT
jgi:hypothetical protein